MGVARVAMIVVVRVMMWLVVVIALAAEMTQLVVTRW